MLSTTIMQIYLRYNAESEKYALMVTEALQKAGHGVFNRKMFSSDAQAMQECHLCLDMTTGKLATPTTCTPNKPTAPKGLKKDVDDRVGKLVLVMGTKVLPRRELLAALGLKQKSRRNFIYNYLKPAWKLGLIDFAHPAIPHLPEQAYRLTSKGLELYAQLSGEKDIIA